MSSLPSRPQASPLATVTLRRLRDAAETKARLSDPSPDVAGPILPEMRPVLPEMRRLLDRLLAAESFDHLAAPVGDDAVRLLAYRARPEPTVPGVHFRLAEAEPGLLRFVGRPAPGFEVLEVRQAGFQFHWRSDLLRAFEEQAAILGTFCAFAPHGELVVENLAVPVIRRHRVREVRGWIALGRDPTDDLCGPDRLAMTRRPLPSRLLKLPRRLMHPQDLVWQVAGPVADPRTPWARPDRLPR